jgi:hypothetical protein
MANYEVWTAADLAKIGVDPTWQLTDNYTQMADIDLSDLGTNWKPIGGQTAVPRDFFQGNYDGQGYTISNMTISNPGVKCVGLFGAININVTLSNIKIVNGQVSGTHSTYVGAVCGYNYAGTIESCSTDAGTTVSSEDSDDVGGICGYSYGVGGTATNAKIIACVNHASVTGGKYLGGVCGYNRGINTDTQGIITACYNTGAVVGTISATQTIHSGGVCGHDEDKFSPISACYNTGAVSVPSGGYAGGVCGWERSEGTIVDCYWAADTGPDYGIGWVDDLGEGSDDGAEKFDDGVWPTDDAGINWGIGNDPAVGEYWASLGGWNSGNPVYPTLWWE